jgi:hypothetical protein
MKKVASTAKKTVISVAKVPQHIGRTIISVPQTISKLANKNDDTSVEEEKPKFADKIAFISREILEDQGRNKLVRESQADCMKEISNHLGSFLTDNPAAKYEEWVAAVHPDNAEYTDGSIDHRFYVKDSDHRILWNKYMQELNCPGRLIEVRSVDPKYNRTY